jgi:nitrous oxidase accessory protein NosD
MKICYRNLQTIQRLPAWTAICALALFLSTLNYQPSICLAQGSLTPLGTPAPTMKTLDQVEARTPVDSTHTPGNGTALFIISQPGSYYLTGNVTGVSGKHGIVISADNVALDLNGFSMTGPGTTQNGVDCGTQKNLVLRNGTIRSWANGVNSAVSATKLRIEKIRAASNATSGVTVGTNCAIVDCLFDASGTTAITTQAGAIVQNCQVSGSTTGISVAQNSLISGCHLTANGLGIGLGANSIVSGCEIVSNTATGIIANAGCMVKDCTVASNSAKGIDTITSGGSSAGTIVQHCIFSGNIGVAIDLSGSCIVRDCMIQPSASADGISMGTVNGSWIFNNQIRNAGATHNGINCNGNNNRIDGNTFTNNATAIAFGASSNNNVVIRNIFLLNTTNLTNGGGVQKDAQIGLFGTGQVSTDPWENIR